MVIATEKFADLCLRVARAYGFEDARMAVVPHPLGSTPVRELESWADAVVEEVASSFQKRED